jgi:hypothetical protein
MHLLKNMLTGLLWGWMTTSSWSQAEDLVQDPVICSSPEPEVCFRGSVRWDKNSRTIEISGQVLEQAPKGSMRFNFSGITGGGEPVVHSTDVQFRGVGKEYLDKRIIPPYSSEVTWSVASVQYFPAP